MKPRIMYGQPAPAYHAMPGASASRLNLLRRRSALHVLHSIQHPSEPTPALVLGEAVHSLVLEPQLHAKRFAVAGTCRADKADGKPCQNVGKVLSGGKWWCGVHAKGKPAESDGRVLLGDDDNLIVNAMTNAVRAHPDAAALLKLGADREVSITWTDEATGCDCKARLDAPAFERAIIVDLKTTEDASPDGFARSVAAYGYDLQARHYLAAAEAAGKPCDSFFFIAVEKAAPHAVGVYRITERNLEAIEGTYRQLLERYAACHATDTWPGYGVADVEIPEWGLKRLEMVG